MLDSKKRRTLKLLSAAPLVPVVGIGAASGAVSAAGLESSATVDSLPLPAARNSSMQLDIQIIDSVAVSENHLLIRNTTDDDLHVAQFMPGHIVYNQKVVDLNMLLDNGTLDLAPGQSKAFDFDYFSVADMKEIEYVWADHTVDLVSEQTSVVRLGAFMADSNAVIYANTKQYAPA